MKTVFLVRHAESAENALMQGVARSVNALMQLSLPSYDDIKSGMELASSMVRGTTEECTLSSNGEAQVAEVRKLLLENEETRHTLKQEQIVVAHSPMLRARMTCEGLFKDITTAQFVELEVLREIVPADYVAPSRWAVAQNRILEFEKWVSERKEDNIIIVGHSHYFKSMLGVDYKFANCEVWKATFRSDAEPKDRWSNLTRICGSSTAKATFGAEWNQEQEKPILTPLTSSISSVAPKEQQT